MIQVICDDCHCPIESWWVCQIGLRTSLDVEVSDVSEKCRGCLREWLALLSAGDEVIVWLTVTRNES